METKELIKSTIQKSPEWLRDLIFSNALEETIISICEPYNYSKETIDDITDMVALVLFGLCSEEKLLENLRDAATNPEEVEQIKNDIVVYILDPIKKDLLEEKPETPVIRTVVAEEKTTSSPVPNMKEIMEFTEIVNYKPGISLKDTLLKKEGATAPMPPQNEKSSFERRLAGFNDNEESKTFPKVSGTDPYREGIK